MKKILYIENNASINAVSFYIAAANAAKRCGLEFHLAYNAPDRDYSIEQELLLNYGVHFHQVDFIRAPYDPRNITAYRQVCNLIRDEEIDFVHCNTPIGGVVGRLAAKECKCTRVIYQAHGFHFFKGAPLANWMIYYPIELWLAHYTDSIITINKEDYSKAIKSLKPRNNGSIYYVPGVGIDLSLYSKDRQKRLKKRKELGLAVGDVALISVGELNANKNIEIIFDALSKVDNKNIHYYVCGVGEKEAGLRRKSMELALDEMIHFMGYRTDISDLLQASDVFVMPSLREGLSRSLMEAMATGLPCVVSNIRGNTDLIEDNVGGFLCHSVNEYADAIDYIARNEQLRERMCSENLKKIKSFDIETVTSVICEIYKKEFGLS